MMRGQYAICAAKVENGAQCKLPPSAHGIESGRNGVEVSHPFVLSESVKK